MVLHILGGVNSPRPIDSKIKKLGGKKETSPPSSEISSKDEVTISSAAQEMAKVSKYVELVKTMDEPTYSDLNSVQNQVNDGSYLDNVGSENIVDALLGD